MLCVEKVRGCLINDHSVRGLPGTAAAPGCGLITPTPGFSMLRMSIHGGSHES